MAFLEILHLRNANSAMLSARNALIVTLVRAVIQASFISKIRAWIRVRMGIIRISAIICVSSAILYALDALEDLKINAQDVKVLIF